MPAPIPPIRPVFVYDGNCGICTEWVEYWHALTGEQVDYRPYQQAAAAYPDIPVEHFAKAVHLVAPDGAVATGAGATFSLYRGIYPQALLPWLYRWLPGFRFVSELGYAFFARNRGLLAFITHLFWGRNFEPPRWQVTAWLFLRLLGLIYLGAFVSFGTQITGLVGADGIMPVTNFMSAVQEQLGARGWIAAPMVFWLGAGDAVLTGTCIAGAVLALLVVFNIFSTAALVLLFALYLSLVIAGQVFMTYQWDLLLLEAGMLAIFLGSGRPLVAWLYRWLAFRFMFLGGLVKIISADPTWDSLTALQYHFETQPLPTITAWFAHHLPDPVLMAMTGATLVIELLLAFLVFAPRRFRMLAAWSFILLQTAILLTGNYNFFNLLTLCTCLFLFDDAALRRVLPRALVQRIETRPAAAPGRVSRAMVWAFAAIVLVSSADLLLRAASGNRMKIAPQVSAVVSACRCVNNYGPFAVMTTARNEIEIEGSADGDTWRAYGFRYKPGPLDRIGWWIIPHQPRVDWQMWFAALSRAEREPWFRNLLYRLLQNSAPVTALLGENPFPDAPPRFIRARFYRYEFTTPGERAATGNWWKRTLVGEYFPAARMQ